MTEFIHGLTLCERYYQEVVRPIFEAQFPKLSYTAGLIGYGSDVLGLDTSLSRDHQWGPRFLVFLSEQDQTQYAASLSEVLRQSLPVSFLGYSTHFTVFDESTRIMTPIEHGPVDHLIEFWSISDYIQSYLGYDLSREPDVLDWLSFSEHKLLGFTSGKIFRDDLGTITALRQKLAFYPDEVWKYLLASEWQKISQEEPFVGRTGHAGDDVGSRIITARLVQSVMRLCFLMEKRYPPYSKWFGTAFAQLNCASDMAPCLEQALSAQDWKGRERCLSRLYTRLAHMHNELHITEPLSEEVSNFHNRPYRVIHAERFVKALTDAIQDPILRAQPIPIGSINQVSDSTDVRENLPHEQVKSLWKIA